MSSDNNTKNISEENRDPFKDLGPGRPAFDLDLSPKAKSGISSRKKSKKSTNNKTMATPPPGLDDPSYDPSPEDKKRTSEFESAETSEKETVKWVYRELAKPRGDDACWDDMNQNLKWYAGSGAILAAMAWPIISPVKVLMPWQWPAVLTRSTAAIRSAYSGSGGTLTRAAKFPLKLSGTMARSIAGYLGGIFFKGWAAGGLTSLKGGWGILSSTWGAANGQGITTSVKGLGTGTINTLFGALKGVKGLGTAFLGVAAVTYAVKKYTNIDGDDQYSRLGRQIIEWLEAISLAELSLDVTLASAMKGMTGASTECFFENTLRSAATLSFYFAGGPAAVAMPQRLKPLQNSIRNAKNGDDVIVALKQHTGLQVQQLTKQLTDELPVFITQAASNAKAKITNQQVKEYVNKLLDQGPEAGLRYLSSKTNINKDAVKQIHNSTVAQANSTSIAFRDELASAVDQLRNTGVVNKRIAEMEQKLAQLKGQRIDVLEMLQVRARAAQNRSLKSSKKMSFSNMTKKTNLDLASKTVKKDLKNFNKLLNDVDAVLINGGDPLKIVKIYRNNIIPLLNQNTRNLDNLLSITAKSKNIALAGSESSKIAAAYVENLKSINLAKSNFFDEFVQAYSKQAGLPNSLKSGSNKIKNAQVSANDVVNILGQQVLKTNKNLNAQDLKVLEKQLAIFHKNMEAAVLSSRQLGSNVHKPFVGSGLWNHAWMLGLSSAAIYYIYSQQSADLGTPVEINDLKTWQSSKLVQALIWEEYGNSPEFFGFKFDSIKRRYIPQYAIDSESESIRTLFKYLYSDQNEDKLALSTFLKKHLFSYEFLTEKNSGWLDKLIEDELIEGKTRVDITPQVAESFIFKYAERLTSQEQLDGLLRDWGESIGSRTELNTAYPEPEYEQYKNKYFPIFLKILIMNSNMWKNLLLLKRGRFSQSNFDYDSLSRQKKIEFIKKNIFRYDINSYIKFGKENVKKIMARKEQYTFETIKRQNPQRAIELLKKVGLKIDADASIVKASTIITNPDKFFGRIFYSLKPGQFYDEEQAKKVPEKTIQNNINQRFLDAVENSGMTPDNIKLPKLKSKQSKSSVSKDQEKQINNAVFKGSKKRYSITDAYQLLKKHENPNWKSRYGYTEEDVLKLAALTKYESGGIPTKFNGNEETMGDLSYGLWQINMTGNMGPRRRERYKLEKNEDLFDPDINAKAAWDLFLDGTRVVQKMKNDRYLNKMSKKRKKRFEGDNIFGAWSPSIKTRKGGKKYRAWLRDVQKLKKLIDKGVLKEMKDSDLKDIVKEILQENYGKGYTPYPYHSHIGQENEPAEDFIQDWKDFELSLVRDESRDTAIRVAKVLIRDLELFGDVLDLVGKNQSVATEILKYLRKNEENS